MNLLKTTFCDACGIELVHPAKCKICGRKICHKCSVWWYNSPTTDNEQLDVYCIKCWELGNPYRLEIEQLLADYNLKLLKLEKNGSMK